jgi:Ca-activated chloride channel family protein
MNGSELNSDWNDALINRGLAEIVGNETPPDLSDCILNAKPQASITLVEPRCVPITRAHHWVMFASAACALIALGTFAFMKPSDSVLTSRSKVDQSVSEASSADTKLAEPISREKLETAVHKYNELRDAERYSEMEKVAKDLYQSAPDDPVAQQVWENAKFVRRELLGREKSALSEEGFGDATRESTTVELPTFETITVTETITVPDGGTILRGGVKTSSEGAGEQIILGDTPRLILQDGRERPSIATEGEGVSDGRLNLNAAGTRTPAIKNAARYDQSDLSVPFRQNSFALEPTASPAAPTTPTAPTAGVPLLAGVPYVEREFRNTGEGREQNMGLQGQINDGEQGEAQNGSTPFPDDPPINYPDDKEWEELSARRKKYASVDLGAPVTAAQDSDGPAGDTFAFRGSNVDRYAAAPATPGFTVDLNTPGRTSSIGLATPEWGINAGNSGDQYAPIEENDFITAKGGDAVSTFSIDVDTASYANVRQFLEQSAQLPPPDAVRIEELVNYFPYDYAQPTDDTPFAANMEVAACPWNPEHRLARIAIKGKEIDRKARPQSNLVFLIDVSGSMDEPAKLPLLIEGMKAFTRELGENDKVAIVVYASSEGMALPSTRGDQQQTIFSALDNLRAGGSTAGGAGIELAYKTATENFIKGGTNRVILCTDGDFNVGVTSTGDLTRLAEQKAKDTKVFLTVLGFGRGNLNDAMMESISGKGNGNYHYVDNLTEARKVLVEEMTGTLVTIAKDVKIQVEFNPAQVAGYRLIGYENRMLATRDFNDDKKDAGEIGAGHTVTALYEIVPAGKEVGTPSVDPLKYQLNSNPPPQYSGEGLGEGKSEPGEDQGFETKGGRGGFEMGNGFGGRPMQVLSNELLTLKLRYKLPEADTSTKVEYPITDKGGSFADASDDFQFAAAVASFGMMLRNSQYKGQTSYDAILEIAQGSLGEDPHGYRAEFLDLIRTAKNIAGEQ